MNGISYSRGNSKNASSISYRVRFLESDKVHEANVQEIGSGNHSILAQHLDRDTGVNST